MEPEARRNPGSQPPEIGYFKSVWTECIQDSSQRNERVKERQGIHRPRSADLERFRGNASPNLGSKTSCKLLTAFSFPQSSVTLEEISSVQDLVRKLEKIELPNQLVSVMGDPALQKLLLLKSSDATLRRVDYWLKAFFDDQSAEGDVEEEAGTRRVLEMLEAIREYVRFGKVFYTSDSNHTSRMTTHIYRQVLPPACLAYLQKELADWNGITGQAVILDLLSYLPLQPFTG